MTNNTILLIILIFLFALLAWTLMKISAQSKVILQKEKALNELATAKLEREMQFKEQLTEEIKLAKKRSNDMQRNVLKGQIGEQFTPFIANFPYNPADCKFMGDPIDYVIFQNLHEHCDGNVPIEDVHIIFAEVKTGDSAKLNKRQKIIKQVIANGQFRFDELRLKVSEESDQITVQSNL